MPRKLTVSLAGLIRSFAALLKPDPGNDEKLQEWARAAQAADLPSVHGFTQGPGPRHERPPPQQSPSRSITSRTEGVNTKTKWWLKRQMYGRADFTLLRHRILLN